MCMYGRESVAPFRCESFGSSESELFSAHQLLVAQVLELGHQRLRPTLTKR